MRHGQEVDAVGHALARLDRRDVGVDQDDLNALLLQRLDGLRARVVEFTGLADGQTAAAVDGGGALVATMNIRADAYRLTRTVHTTCNSRAQQQNLAQLARPGEEQRRIHCRDGRWLASDLPQEHVEEELRVERAAVSLGVELDGEVR